MIFVKIVIRGLYKMENQLFREKSLERISSPEELNDYLRVSTPNLWLTLVAVIVLLVGLLVWASVGKLETTIDAVAEIENNYVEVTLTGSDAEKIDEGMTIRIGNFETNIDVIRYDDLGRAVAVGNADIPDGNYKAEIVIENIHPIQFLFK